MQMKILPAICQYRKPKETMLGYFQMERLMNSCPLSNENTACDLPVSETEGNDGDTPKVVYCAQCSEIAFRCSSGHWNRVFARFCTQCGDKLEKPATWDMASANPQRTALLSQVTSVDSLDSNHGFSSWVIDTPEIAVEVGEDLPGLIAIDGFIIVPNPSENRLDAYKIAKPSDQKSPNLEWSITLDAPLTRGSTPVYHGLHLYYVTADGIQRKSVLGDEAQPVNISGVDAAQIESAPGYAPLKCEINGEPTMIVGLKQGVLLFNLSSHNGDYIKDMFFEKENRPMSPVLCDTHVVFTSQTGQIFSLNIKERPYTAQLSPWSNLLFSAPVSLGNQVYFEALNGKGNRRLALYKPTSDELVPVADLGTDSDLDRRLSLFLHPTLTDGERLFFSDTSGQTVNTYYHSRRYSPTQNRLTPAGNDQPVFVPHRSVLVNNRVYSAHPAGLTVFSPDQSYTVSGQSLTMGRADNPVPVVPPIRYGNKLFVLCRDRLVCLNY